MSQASLPVHSSEPSKSGGATPLGVHPLVDALAHRIRNARSRMPQVHRLGLGSELEAISGSLDGESLSIHNELYQCRGLRKMHLEIARMGAGLQILHCVFFPDPRFDLPIFGADVVAGRGVVSAAIVDLSPVTGRLPARVDAALRNFPRPAFSQVRELPTWGAIFSSNVLFVRPTSNEEEGWFIEQVEGFLAVMAEAVNDAVEQPWNHPATVTRRTGQLYYCNQQKQNDKTRRVLEKVFSPQWADQYIEQLLFDDPPELSPLH